MDRKRMTGGPLGAAVAQRIKGEKPGAFRAMAAATLAGGATGVVVYQLLRR
jgi:ABC-type uncharacterized transport system permease subunit